MDGSGLVDEQAPPSGPGCVECTQAGGWWLHLRRCASCGHVGCCDTSPSQHASAHARASGHPVLCSFEPGEAWCYDVRTDEYLDALPLAPPHHHPLDQGVPGPKGQVPADWQSHLH